jgi:hypothetical protein
MVSRLLDWRRLFPDGDYRFHLGLRAGEAAAFFGPDEAPGALLEERCRWLDQTPEAYAACIPEGADLLEETIEMAGSWGVSVIPGLLPGFVRPADRHALSQRCVELARRWAPDFLLLRRGSDSTFRLVGGGVCFPSSWALQDKLGLPVAEVHGVVPGLNAALGRQIDRFLEGLAPGAAWERENWGLSRDAELNHHPRRRLPRLDASVTLDTAWLRIEHQAFVRLPRTGGVLFGIRLSLHPLRAVAATPLAAQGLARALATMPIEVARYKGLSDARGPLLRALGGWGTGGHQASPFHRGQGLT